MKKLLIAIVILVVACFVFAQPLQLSLTNLTQFVNQTGWRLFYANTDGDVTELALGANGTYLKSNGASSAPTWAAPSGSGDILQVWDVADGDVATPTIESGEYLDGGTATVDAASEGILLPRGANVASATAEGQISWDTDDDKLYVGDGAAVVEIAGSGMSSFIAEDGDGTEVSISNAEEWKFVEGNGINIDWTDVSNGSDADPFDLTFALKDGVAVSNWNLTTATITTSIQTTTPKTIAVAELDRLDGLAGIIVTDVTAVTDIEGTGLSIGGATLNWAAASTDLSDTADLLYEAELDDFSELQAQIADKTVVNEEDAVTWDALGTFDLGVTITTGDPFTLGVNRIDNGSDLLDGEQVGNDTIDNDSIDWGDMTDLTTDGAVSWGNVAAGELGNDSVINEDIDDDGNFVFTGNWDFGGGDLELPQGQTPDTDGDIDLDFTDGSVVIQHGAAHAELAGATDVVVGKLIHSFSATIFAPDGVNDVIPLKMIDDLEFPHGVVIVECLLQVGTDTNYTLTLQNYDDFDTINAGDGTIDAVAYTAGNDGEVTDTAITFGTIAAGQIIMMSIPSTDVDWIHIEVFYYEPIA